MKKTLLFMICLLAAPALFGSIVNNSTSSPTAEDSLSFIFYSLDSLGNPTLADSLYILVSGPGGSLLYRDSVTISDSRITSTTIMSKQFYAFKDQVSNIDGSGAAGHYSITLLAKKNSGNLLTPNVYSFQVISEELSDQLELIGDSVYVKGGAVDSNRTELGSAVDSTMIARSVWNTPQSNHTTSSTFGKYLDTEVSGIGSGSGAYAFTLQMFDSTNAQVIPHANLAVRNVDQSALIAIGKADTYGRAGFYLDADSFVVVATAPGYTFETCDTLVVTGAGVDTLFGDQFDPGSPSYPSFCRTWGYLHDASGQPETGVTVSAYLPSGITQYGITMIAPSPVTVETDSSGYFYLDLLPSDSLGSEGVEYEFTINRKDGTILRKRLHVPDSTSWRLVW